MPRPRRRRRPHRGRRAPADVPCCHPALTPESRAALTLRLVGGLTTAEIARGFLVKDVDDRAADLAGEADAAEVGADFSCRPAPSAARRLDDVMAVVYLVFNEGYAGDRGRDWMRPDLCLEAIRLAGCWPTVPDEPEVHGLQALLELQASRLRAHRRPDGRPVLLEAQDRRRWDQLLIRRGLAALDRAEELARGRSGGPLLLQAAIAACHARARTAGGHRLGRIAAPLRRPRATAPGAVVEVNRAVAHGRAFGPDAGLAVLEAIPAGALAGSPVCPPFAVTCSADRAGRAEAAAAFREAAAATSNNGEQALLEARALEAEQSLSS